jgi:hypothetical protein
MLHSLNFASYFRRILGKSPAEASTIRSILLLAVLLVTLANLSACHFFGPKCKFCGASLSAGKVHTAEGYDVCHECDREAVRDLRTAQTLVAQVRKEILSLGISLPWGEIPIKLAPSANASVHARCEAARYANGSVASVWIRFMPGMPKSMFKATAAHELTHAWAYLNRSPAKQDEALSEGGPTLVEYTYLESNPSLYSEKRRDAIMTSSNKIYGKSTRSLQAYAKDHGGLAGVLNLLKTGQSIPAGY